jgi:hypothetical protein
MNEIKVHIGAVLDQAAFDNIYRNLRDLSPQDAAPAVPEPAAAPAVVAGALVVAAASQAQITRRSLLGLWWKRGPRG